MSNTFDAVTSNNLRAAPEASQADPTGIKQIESLFIRARVHSQNSHSYLYFTIKVLSLLGVGTCFARRLGCRDMRWNAEEGALRRPIVAHV